MVDEKSLRHWNQIELGPEDGWTSAKLLLPCMSTALPREKGLVCSHASPEQQQRMDPFDFGMTLLMILLPPNEAEIIGSCL